VAQDGPVPAVIDQRAPAVARGVVEPVAELGRAAELPRPGMAAPVAQLHRESDRPGPHQLEPVTEGRAPCGGPVDHERPPGRAGRAQQGLRARQVRRHGLLDHDRKPAPERLDPELDRAPVVGEHEDSVEILAVQQGLVARQGLDARVSARQALAKPRIRIGGGHDPAMLAGGERSQIPPDVVVGQPENPDAQSRDPRHGRPLSGHGGSRISRLRASRAGASLAAATGELLPAQGHRPRLRAAR
jgi:hypothetical protein